MENMEVDVLKKTFKNKKVFLTGHTGFKGAWLLNILHALGAELKGYALAPTNENDIYNQVNAKALCNSIIADIMDMEKLKKEIIDFQPDFIFHLAAQPLVRLSYEKPQQTFLVNALGTVNILESIRSLDKPCVVVLITTDKVYRNLETEHYYTENETLGGYDPYSASKACAELIIDSYRNSFFNSSNYDTHKKSISVARAGNVIGGGDWSADRIIPDIINALSQHKPIQVRNPNSVRPWQHVLEPLFGYITLAAKQVNEPVKYQTAFNFGPEKNDILPVSQLVTLAVKNWGQGTFEVQTNSDNLHEAGLLHLDITKAKLFLGWRPKMNSEQAIKHTIDWYKVMLNNKHDIIDFTKQQIDNYLNKI